MNKSLKKNIYRKALKYLIEDRYYIYLILPAFVYFLLFHYLPMFGIIIAFKNYSISKGFIGSPWVGFKWFAEFINSFYFLRILRNTVLLNIYGIIFGFPLPIIFALMLNEIKRTTFKRITQTISYLPYFISTVVIVGIIVNFLELRTGIINHYISSLGGKQIDFMGNANWFRTIFISTNIWQFFGFSSIIYLSAISSIEQEQYESLTVDGGNKLQGIIHITIPGILPTIIILLILNLGSMLSSNFEKIVLMYNPSNYETADVISTYVYRSGILGGSYSYSAAVGFFTSIVNFVVLVLVNKFSKKISEISLW